MASARDRAARLDLLEEKQSEGPLSAGELAELAQLKVWVRPVPVGGGGDYDPADDYHGGYDQGNFSSGSVDPQGADHIGGGGLLDLVDSVSGGSLSSAHDVGVDEIGGLAATGPGGRGWGFDPGDIGLDSADSADDASGHDTDPGGDFKEGGYTGAGRDRRVQPNRKAGTVHEGEYVLPAEAVEAIGVSKLDALRDEATALRRQRILARRGSQGASMRSLVDVAGTARPVEDTRLTPGALRPPPLPSGRPQPVGPTSISAPDPAPAAEPARDRGLPAWRSQLRRTLMQDEGYRERPYPDADGLSQGFGSQILESGDASRLMHDPSLREPSEQERHLQLFLRDEATAIQDARKVIPGFDRLPDQVKIATASMAYQMGRDGLAGFTNMRRAIARGDWTSVAGEMLDSKWAQEDTPARAKRLAAAVAKIGTIHDPAEMTRPGEPEPTDVFEPEQLPTITVQVPEVADGKATEIPLIVADQKNVDRLIAGEEPTFEQEAIAIRAAAKAEKPDAEPPPDRSAALKELAPPRKGRKPTPMDVPAAPKGGDKEARELHRSGTDMLELARGARKRIGSDEFAEIDRRIRWYKPGGAAKLPEAERGLFSEFTGAFSKSLIESNPEMYGASLEAAGLLAGSRDVARWGVNLQKWAKKLDAGRAPSVASIRDINGIEDAFRFILGGMGSGLGSTVPSIVGGAGGAAAGSMVAPGPGTVVGAATGALIPAAPLNMGEAYLQFKEEKIPPKLAAQAAAAITPALAALDLLGLWRTVGGALTRDAKTGVLRHVAKSILRGFGAEGLTEGSQSALREGVAAALTGNPDLRERALNVLDEAVIGGLTGAAIGGPAGVASRPRAPETREEAPDDLPPEEPEGGPDADAGVGGGVAPDAPVAPGGPAPDAARGLDPGVPGEAEAGPAAGVAPAGGGAGGRGVEAEAARQTWETANFDLDAWNLTESDDIVAGVRDTLAAVESGQKRLQEAVDEIETVYGELVDQSPDASPQTEWLQGVLGFLENEQNNIDPDVAAAEALDEARQTAGVAPTAEEVDAAAAETDTDPTEAQKKAGNYKKGSLTIAGLDIAIENPKGSKRSGTDKGGKKWTVTMPAHYGYVKRTEGADGDQLDVYVGPNPEADTVFVVDQVDADTGRFDEHKAFIGFPDQETVEQTYDKAFNDGKGPQRRRKIIPVPMVAFKRWLTEGDTSKAAAPRGARAAAPAAAPQEPPAQRKKIKAVAAGAASRVITPSGRRIGVQPEVVEAEDLVTSHDEGGNVNPAYPEEMQPRDRSRIASQAWIVDTAANLDPERLMPMTMSGDGAPIIDSAGNVESGNGRVLAIRRAYAEGQAEGYRGFLKGRGIDVDQFTAPVLVQRRTTDLPAAERAEYTEESNVPTVTGRSVSEIAAADAGRLTVDTLALYRGGPLTHATNREFVRRYVETVVPEATRSELMTADGELSQQGVERIQNAVFAKAYGDVELLGRLREETEGSVRTIGAAMIEAGAEWAAMREAAADGRIGKGLDVTEDLLAAVRLVETARRDHRSLANAVRQTDILKGNALSENGEKLLALMFRDVGVWTQPSGRERLVTGLQKYTGEALKGAAGRDMFGYEASPGPILEAAYDEQDRVHGAADGTARPAPQEPDDHFSFSATARSAPDQGMTKADVEAAIAPIVGKWTSRRAPAVRVVQSWTELPLSEKNKAYVEERMALDGDIAPRGMFRRRGRQGEVYLVASELRTANDAREVLAHEAVGHYSVMEMVGQDWGAVVKDVMRLVESGDPQVKPIADQVRRNYGDVDDNTFAAEVIAHMAEKNVRR